MFNGLFGKSKTNRIYKLESENAELLSKIKDLEMKNSELQQIIDAKGYKVPEVKTLHFIHSDKWLVNTHFSSIINAMNANEIEIISYNLDEKNEGGSARFTIKYRLPPNMKSASFDYTHHLGIYDSAFEFKYK